METYSGITLTPLLQVQEVHSYANSRRRIRYGGIINNGNADFGLIKTDANGVMIWNKTYGGTGFDLCRGLVATRDGGYAMAGFTTSYGAGGYDIWLVKTDLNGNSQWNKTYGGVKDDKLQWFGLIETNDGYSLTGYTQNYGAGGTNVGSFTRPSGQASDYPTGTDAWLIKTDSFGNIQFTETFGDAADDYGTSIIKTKDSGIAIIGTTYSTDTSNWDMWLIKVGFDGESGLAWTDSTSNTLTLYRGANDIYWNYVRVQVWKIK